MATTSSSTANATQQGTESDVADNMMDLTVDVTSGSPASSSIQIVPFAVPLPTELSVRSGASSSGSGAEKGVVGTVTILGDGGGGVSGTNPEEQLHSKKPSGALGAAIVWVGWGIGLRPSTFDSGVPIAAENIKDRIPGCEAVGNGLPTMGPMAVAMPRTRYGGVGGSDDESPVSQLVGGENEEDQVIGMQMASRLSKRCKRPVFVSCSFGSFAGVVGDKGGDGMGLEGAMGGGYGGQLSMRAAALAEREVGRILNSRGR